MKNHPDIHAVDWSKTPREIQEEFGIGQTKYYYLRQKAINAGIFQSARNHALPWRYMTGANRADLVEALKSLPVGATVFFTHDLERSVYASLATEVPGLEISTAAYTAIPRRRKHPTLELVAITITRNDYLK